MEAPFDYINDWPEWRRENIKEFERIAALGAKLWGTTENLKRQLELPSPEIPAEATMKDLLALEQRARDLVSALHTRLPNPTFVTFVTGLGVRPGDTPLNVAEACYEVVRRAIAAMDD